MSWKRKIIGDGPQRRMKGKNKRNKRKMIVIWMSVILILTRGEVMWMAMVPSEIFRTCSRISYLLCKGESSFERVIRNEIAMHVFCS